MCVAGYWYGGSGRVRQPRGLAYPVGWGTLGFGFPAGLGEQPLGCDLEPLDFVALARAFRVEAREVAVADLGQAVADGVASGRPSLLVVRARFTPPLNTSPNWYRAERRSS